jgi:hypothetical protein
MPLRLIVIREDARADALLVDVARRLGLARLAPDEHGDVAIALDAAGDAEWQRVRDALDAAGDDWWAYFHLPPQPRPAAGADA